MKITPLLLLLALLFCSKTIFAQVTNVKQGLWSDPTVWSNNVVPDSTDNVVLNFNIVINANAYCWSLTTNEHSVTVDAGVVLDITGHPVTASDTATLGRIINAYYNNDGTTFDSTIRIIKNSYVNGLKRIALTLFDFYTDSGTTYTDTSYATFNYNTQNQLIGVHFYDTDTADGTFNENITWQNNLVTKITSDSSGSVSAIQNFTYAAAGINTNITSTGFPPEFGDTLYTDNTNTTIEYISDSKSYVTVNSSFTAVSQSTFNYEYFINNNGVGGPMPSNDYDTIQNVYSYTNSNLSTNTAYTTGTHNDPENIPVISYLKDTSNYIYSRHLTENATVNQLLQSVYGNDLLTLMNFFDTDISYYDLLGDPGDNTVDYDFDAQTIDSASYTEIDWVNGSKLPAEYVDEKVYKADNTLDSQNRLVKSKVYDLDLTTVQKVMWIIYP